MWCSYLFNVVDSYRLYWLFYVCLLLSHRNYSCLLSFMLCHSFWVCLWYNALSEFVCFPQIRFKWNIYCNSRHHREISVCAVLKLSPSCFLYEKFVTMGNNSRKTYNIVENETFFVLNKKRKNEIVIVWKYSWIELCLFVLTAPGCMPKKTTFLFIHDNNHISQLQNVFSLSLSK